MRAEHVSVPGTDGDIPVFAIHSDAVKSPGLVIMPSIFGVDEDLQRQARLFAEHGAVVYALDPFWRTDPGPADPTKGEMERAVGRGKALPFEKALRDLETVVAALRADESCNGKIVGLGICFGGSHVVVAGANRKIDAIAAWHGTSIGNHMHRASDLECPISLHFGGRDELVSMVEVSKIEDALIRQRDVEIVVHSMAGHGFSHAGRPQHVPDAESAGLESVKRLLTRMN